MKYCINHRPDSQYLFQADEINIPVTSKTKMTYDAACQILEKYPNQRVNFILPLEERDESDYDYYATFFAKVYEQHKNFSVRVYSSSFAISEIMNIAEVFDYNNVPYYFSCGANTWEMFHYLMTTKVTDIYVVEGLGFELNRIKEAKEDKQIRVFPNVAQAAWNIDPIKQFFIIPQHVDDYESFVDVMDLSFDLNKDDKYFTDTLYEIYAVKKVWNGNLNNLIMDLHMDIDARVLTRAFAQARIECGRRCFKGKPCDMCKSCVAFAEILYEKYLKQTDKEIREYLQTGEIK